MTELFNSNSTSDLNKEDKTMDFSKITHDKTDFSKAFEDFKKVPKDLLLGAGRSRFTKGSLIDEILKERDSHGVKLEAASVKASLVFIYVKQVLELPFSDTETEFVNSNLWPKILKEIENLMRKKYPHIQETINFAKAHTKFPEDADFRDQSVTDTRDIPVLRRLIRSVVGAYECDNFVDPKYKYTNIFHNFTEIGNVHDDLHWFDFRGQDYTNEDLIESSFEAMEAGLIGLPFEQCVFVIGGKANGSASSMVVRMEKAEGEKVISCSGVLLPSKGRGSLLPKNLLTSSRILDYMCASIGILSSKSVDRVVYDSKNRITGSGVPKNSKNRTGEYTKVVISSKAYERSENGSNGERLSPRMHWRRGHIRNHKNGSQLWIAPTLVGVDKNMQVKPKNYILK